MGWQIVSGGPINWSMILINTEFAKWWSFSLLQLGMIGMVVCWSHPIQSEGRHFPHIVNEYVKQPCSQPKKQVYIISTHLSLELRKMCPATIATNKTNISYPDWNYQGWALNQHFCSCYNWPLTHWFSANFHRKNMRNMLCMWPSPSKNRHFWAWIMSFLLRTNGRPSRWEVLSQLWIISPNFQAKNTSPPRNTTTTTNNNKYSTTPATSNKKQLRSGLWPVD